MSIRNITADVKVLCQVPLEEAKTFISWIWQSLRQTQFDMTVMAHPRMVMATARDENGPLVQIPLQSVLMFDCMATKPGIDNRTKAYAMWKIGEEVEKVMKDTGNMDCFLYTNDDPEAESLVKHGWTELKGVRLMRKRISVPEYAVAKLAEVANV